MTFGPTSLGCTMNAHTPNRRDFLHSTAAASLLAAGGTAAAGPNTLAALGGTPVRKTRFPSWPVLSKNDRDAWGKVLDEGKWCRIDGTYCDQFERAFAGHMGSRHCTVTANGTSALYAALNALGVGPGDEVLVPPYTFVATVNVVLLQYALPVFVDTDRETFQLDARKLESAITPRTRCILPVHLGGNPADLDTILAVAKKHQLPVLEDACQAHLGEWRGKKLGAVGTAGCFSFQASKNLNSGEGGAVLSDDDGFMEKCFAFHNNGRRRRGSTYHGFSYSTGGANLRMTEFQAALLLQQMTRWEEQSKIRDANAAYLTKHLGAIPGILPMKRYAGCTRNGLHLYMFRFDASQFGGGTRTQFVKALRAEGIPCTPGYTPLNKEPFLRDTFASRGYQQVFGAERLQAYLKHNHCPENDRLCEEAVWFGQTVLLAKQSDMEQIVEAVRKLHANAPLLAKVT